jgi:dTMP kinase
MSIASIDQVNQIATGGLVPDMTFYFEVDVATAYARRNRQTDRMEESGIEFYARVIEGYRQLAQQNPLRFVTLDATLPMEHIHQLLWQHLLLKLDL